MSVRIHRLVAPLAVCLALVSLAMAGSKGPGGSSPPPPPPVGTPPPAPACVTYEYLNILYPVARATIDQPGYPLGCRVTGRAVGFRFLANGKFYFPLRIATAVLASSESFPQVCDLAYNFDPSLTYDVFTISDPCAPIRADGITETEVTASYYLIDGGAAANFTAQVSVYPGSRPN